MSKKKPVQKPATTHDEIMRQIAVLAARISEVESGLVSVRQHSEVAVEEMIQTRDTFRELRSFVNVKFLLLEQPASKQSWFSWLRGAGAGR
jgi:hypothetical protein